MKLDEVEYPVKLDEAEYPVKLDEADDPVKPLVRLRTSSRSAPISASCSGPVSFWSALGLLAEAVPCPPVALRGSLCRLAREFF